MSTQLKTRPVEEPAVELHDRAADLVERTAIPETTRVAPRSAWWLPALAIVAALVVVAVLAFLASDGGPTGTDYAPEFNSPGGNSLVIPAVVNDAFVPAFDGPGGNSLTIPADVVATFAGSGESPGGNSLNIP